MKKIYKRDFERSDKRHLLLFGYEEHNEKAAKELDFMLAAQLRDEYFALKEKIAEKKK